MKLPAFSAATFRQAGIILLALYTLAGVAYSALLPAVPRFPDEKEYAALTDHLLHGPGYSMDGTHLTAARSPGYPFFMAAIETVDGGIVAIRVCQVLLTAAIVLLIVRLFPANARAPAVLTTCATVAIYPLFFYANTTLYPQSLAAFLFVLAMSLLLTGKSPWLAAGGCGAAFGYLILVVPTFLFTLAVAMGTALVLKLIDWRRALFACVLAAVVVGCWTARNYAEFHIFVPVASNSGANFLIGNCENTIPTGGSGNVDTTHYHRDAQALGLDEFQEDRFYRDAALTWIEGHPGRALVLYLEKSANFFNVYNAYAPESKAEVTPWRQALLGGCYALLLALLAWRLMEAKRFPLTTQEIFLLAVYVLSAFTSAIFFTRIRLRLPYDYLIVAVVAMHLARHLQLWMGIPARDSTSV